MLTKSDFNKYLECPIWLWLKKHRPDLITEESPETLRRFAMGNQVDELAKSLFPDGIEIHDHGVSGLEETQAALSGDASTIFQPTVSALDLWVRADIIIRNRAKWDIHEVKMTSSTKPEHIFDVAFQRICFEAAGLKVGRTYLTHLNNEYVRHGDIEPKKLFRSDDITAEVLDLIDETKKQIDSARKILAIKSRPSADLINACYNPKNCEYCETYVLGFPDVYEIAGDIAPKHLKALLERGLLDPSKLPKNLIQKSGFVSEAPFTSIDKAGIKAELAKLKYPLSFFDYETYAEAIPLFDDTRPYQAMPFQYSLDIRETPGGPLIHKEFLASSYQNPMPELLEHLKADMPAKGTVIAWFAPFEKGRNDEMAEAYPKYAGFLKKLNDRVYDLMLLFKGREGLYLTSEFQKSASLKAVLPVICPDLAYTDLVIQEGGTASASWPILTGNTISLKEKEKLAKNMLAYCKRDTEAMVCILDKVTGEAR